MVLPSLLSVALDVPAAEVDSPMSTLLILSSVVAAIYLANFQKVRVLSRIRRLFAPRADK
jgi:hypothetical protein